MPITRPINKDEPLSQGDILKGVRLSVSDIAGETQFTKSELSLVISRPCVVAHKTKIVLATIEPIFLKEYTEIDTLDKAKVALAQLRDGVVQRDRFYLGKIHDCGNDRYAAHLDSLHTVVRSSKQDGSLAEQLVDSRVARLEPDFQRDLHRRIFESFVYLGFDDSNWYDTEDLEWVIAVGKSESAKLEAAASNLARQIIAPIGNIEDEKKAKGLTIQKTGSDNSKKKVEEQLAPLIAVSEKRKADESGVD